MWRYSLPLFISILFICLTQLGFYYLIFPAMLLANIMNWIWGEFSTKEILQELKIFYGSPRLKIIKRINALGLIAMILWAVHYFDHHIYGYVHFIFFTIATGSLTGCFVVTLAHDLLHENNNADKNIAASLLIVSGIPHLAGDHVLGHHRTIGLKQDASTAPLNRNVYTFLYHTFIARLKNSFTYRMKLPRYILKKLLKANILMLAALIIAWLLIFLFALRPFNTLAFFIGQGAIAYLLYEIINYIQHYGLKRKSEKDPIALHHSWNCYYKYTNYILYMLPLHSLHHLPANARQIPVNKLKDGPRMPYLYFTMVFMALIPPLWFKVMNPHVIRSA